MIPKRPVLPTFDTAKKTGVLLRLTKEWHSMFSYIAERDGSNPNEIINYPLEKGIVVSHVCFMFNRMLKNKPVDERTALARDFIDFMMQVMNGQVMPGQVHIKQANISCYASPVEKLGAIRLLTKEANNTFYKSYRIPKVVKKFCQDIASKQSRSLSEIILEFMMTGITLMFNIQTMQTKRQEELSDLDKQIMQLYYSRIIEIKYDKSGNFQDLRVAEFIKKKDTTPELMLKEITT